MGKFNNLLWSGISSVFLLVVFFILQWFDSPLLNLDFKWVTVAGVPILIGLLYSGIIKNFKGFGIELETHFAQTVKQVEIIGELKPKESPGRSKDSLQSLFNINETERQKIQRLIFENKRRNYYNVSVVSEYFQMLPNLKFFEVKEKIGTFNCLIPLSSLMTEDENLDREKLRKFISAIERGNVQNAFDDAVSSYLTDNDSITKAYKKINQSKGLELDNDRFLPVLNKNHELIGLTGKNELGAKISSQVIDLIENK